MVDLELLGELAKIVLRDCSKWQICIAGDVGHGPSAGAVLSAGPSTRERGAALRARKTTTSFQVLFNAQSSIRNGRVPANSPGVVDIDRWPTETDAWQHIKKMVTAEGPRCSHRVAEQARPPSTTSCSSRFWQAQRHAFMERDRVI
jgi:hypothetical protein